MQRKIVKLNTLTENIEAEKRYNANLSKKYFAVWDNFPIQKLTAEIEQEILDKYIDKYSKVCVLGSGGGRELPVLLDKQCAITAVDISPDMLAIGQQRFLGEAITWLESDLHALPEHLQDMDAAVCVGAVFNYLYDPALALQNFRRTLKNNSILIISFINTAHASEADSKEFLNGQYRRLYSLPEMEELLRTNGFEPITSRGIRFLVDMVPASWGQPATATSQQMQIVQNLLELEKEMLEMMPADKAKFINIVAKAI